ncbi:class I SAM-dependent methyltransferase [Nonomuraea salmonea]|uniref:class I SAM-dependent methyltransferase n=1 Tax=Nonomuraea salmonea TaxID=46181 RepID=UPI002FE735CA
MGVDRRRSVVFGEAVEQYEAARPGYPERLVTEVLAYAPDGPVLEVGAGTGKATAGFAAHVSDLTCVEPDPRMAAALTAKCPGVRVVSGIFEDYVPDRRFALLYSAQAWHWVDPDRRWDLAHDALAPSGALALFWNHYIPADDGVRAALGRLAERYGLASQSLHQNEGDRAEESRHLLEDDPPLHRPRPAPLHQDRALRRLPLRHPHRHDVRVPDPPARRARTRAGRGRRAGGRRPRPDPHHRTRPRPPHLTSRPAPRRTSPRGPVSIRTAASRSHPVTSGVERSGTVALAEVIVRARPREVRPIAAVSGRVLPSRNRAAHQD